MKFKIDIQYIITILHLPKVKRKDAYRLITNLDREIHSLADLIEYLIADGNVQMLSLLGVGDFNNALQIARKIIQQSADLSIKMVSILDNDYPKLLRTIDDPPVVLNYIGDIASLSTRTTIAVIGTRTPSAFGTRYAKHVACYFAKRGFNIISGLATGCDTAAHLGAIDGNGATSAVLANGLDTIYPKENKALAEQIKESGVLVSEYFVGKLLTKNNFIERDRIQAALSLGVFIVESTIKSGTMHTANFAISYNRILACMKPPLRYFTETRVSGNQMLSQSGKAVAVYEDNELEELSTALKIIF